MGLEEKKMTLSTRDVLGIILAGAMFYAYVSNTRPVSWFDSVVALLLSVAVFWVVKTFKGFKW